MQRPINVKSRPRLPIPDEDPYSIAGNLRNDNSDSSGYSNGGSGGSGSGGGSSNSSGVIIDANIINNGKHNLCTKTADT